MNDRGPLSIERRPHPDDRAAHGARLPAHRVTGAFSRAPLPIVERTLSILLRTALLPTLGIVAPQAPARVRVENTRTLELVGGRLRYQSTGTGDEALLFLHGFNSQLSIWDDLWPLLADGGRSVRLDIAGFGGSDWRASSYSLPAQADRVILFMNALGLTRVTLVGVSMGGSLSAWIAARHPDRVKGLVLLAPSGYPGGLRYLGLFGKLLRPGGHYRWATRIADTDLYRLLHPNSTALQALTVTASYGEPWARALADIRVHAWLLWSRGDACVPFSYADAVTSAIPASTLVPLSERVGHNIPANRPELIAALASRVHRGAKPEHVVRALADILKRNGDA